MNFNFFRGIVKTDDLTPPKYNGDWMNLQSWWNDHDNGIRAWTSLLANALNMNGNKITNIANGTASTDAAAVGQIKYLQAAQGTSTTAKSTASATFVDTNLTVSITPTSASNRIKISFIGQCDDGTGTMAVTVARGGTNLLGTDGFGRYTSSVASQTVLVSGVYIDSPATTSATTYSVQVRSISGTIVFGNLGTQVIVVEEIV